VVGPRRQGELLRGAAAVALSRARLISPAEFITVAEETGLINELGHWALETRTGRELA
jgi:EAL domain-containing protein (putative c-di-GMP-specific phosphodiesterase class I)